MYYLGGAMNLIAIAANQGTMPVLWPAGCALWEADILHSCMTKATHLKWMCDWLVLKGLGVASIGDLLVLWSEDIKIPFLYVWIVLVIKELNG